MSQPTISLIFAMDQHRLIGKNNGLPWRLPADLAYFMRTTMGHHVVMGRKTFESLAKPLPGRTNVVLTRDVDYAVPEGCVVMHSVDEVLDDIKEEAFFVIGGSEIYKLFLPLANRLYITHIEAEFEGDAYFPQFNDDEWHIVSQEKGIVDEHNPYPHVFVVYERRKG